MTNMLVALTKSRHMEIMYDMRRTNPQNILVFYTFIIWC